MVSRRKPVSKASLERYKAALNMTTTEAVPPAGSVKVRLMSRMVTKLVEFVQLYSFPSTPENFAIDPDRLTPAVAAPTEAIASRARPAAALVRAVMALPSWRWDTGLVPRQFGYRRRRNARRCVFAPV